MFIRSLPVILASLVLLAATAVAQEEPFPYQVPPDELVALVDAPPPPAVQLSPDRQWMLLIERPALPGLIELAQPEVGLAGVRLNPRTNGPSRSQTFSGLTFRQVASAGAERRVTGLPDDARIRNVSWSPNGRLVAFTLDLSDEIALFAVDVEDARARRLTPRAVSDAIGRPFTWLPDSRLVVTLIPEDRGPAPEPDPVPVGPVVQETTDVPAPARTFQNLLEDAHDEALFEHYFDAELVLIDVSGANRPLGIRGLVRSVSNSPDGRYLLVQRTQRPFSYLVPVSRFPTLVTAHDAATGDLVQTIAEQPLADNIPLGFGSVQTGPRNFGWRANAPATLVWAEALDGGDIRAEADWRDRVFTLDAPFDAEPRELMDTRLRYAGIMWLDNGEAFVNEFLFQDRLRRTYQIDPDAEDPEPRMVFELITEDRYADPGSPVTRADQTGYSLVVTEDDGNVIYLSGMGASPEGNRPFLHRYDLRTGETEELFRSASPYYEVPIDLLADGRYLLTRRESPTERANFFLRDLETGALTVLTDFPHPYPELANVHREVVEYQRADGIPLTATLYLPPGYDPETDGPLPTLVWAYPREFRTMDAAGQRTDSPYQFTNISYWGPVAFVTRGYAVLNNASMPIVGEGDEEPNDTFVEQLVLNAEAVIGEGVRRGVIDPDRVAVGGHSYGAFMTANLLAHTDLFRAGIARSGAFNRTLTPFGFQFEQRTYWEAPEVYNTMSPFMQAHRINQPILLIHGAADDNSGTFPMQSERMYSAIAGLGGTARLVMLPHESHGYRARESVLHMLWEQDQWLERYVRNGEPAATAEPEADAATAGG